MQQTTLLFLIKGQQILLAMKKRGSGVGKWNGVGGKVGVGESIVAATIRECQEEIGVTPLVFEKVGEFDFRIPSRQFHNYTHVYLTRRWRGQPTESEEMAPKWFNFEEIPYDSMWSDDRLWLTRVLTGEKLTARFVFDDQERITQQTIRPLTDSIEAFRPLLDARDSATESPTA